ncbi:hypothetical protein ACNAUY_16550, partial [Acinetobacter tibetensis]
LYWLHEYLFPQKQSERNIGDIQSLHKECLNLLKLEQNMQKEILNKLEILRKISETFFNWVHDSDIRNLIWVQNRLDFELLNKTPSLFGINTNNDKIIYSKFRLCLTFDKIDSVDPQINNQSLFQSTFSMQDKKVKFIENIKIQWNNWIIQTDKFSRWLENLDQKMLWWCYNYISKKELHSSNINLEKTITPLMVLILIDSINFETTESYIIYIERLKKSWSQYKFKSSKKVKNKYHLPLTKQTKNFLEQLAKFKNKSEAEVMEELLKKEYQDLMCDERGNLKY